MKKDLWLLLTVLAVALCVTAQAETTMNEFPFPDAVPEVYTLFPSEMPPLPQAEFTQEGTVRISGLSAWDVSPDMLTDWELQFNSWISGSPGLYEDELLVTYVADQNSAIPVQGQGYSIPLKLTGEKHCEMVLNVSADYENPRIANLSIAFRNEEGTEAQLLEDGSLLIEKEIDTDTDKHKTVMYYLPDGTLDVIESSVFVPGQFP